MEYGDFSANADSEETFFPCQRSSIPILPVRFSLLPYDLEGVQEPTSIGNPGSYIIRTLRRGFVYVYVENPQETDDASDRKGPGAWYVFRYDTKGQDINGDFVPSDTDSYHRADYSFTKYEWTDNYGADTWKYDSSTPASKTIWVPKWASKVWLAYSEYRWPPSFFRQGHQESFRQQIMQPVNLRGQNQWAAYIGRAEELVEEYKPTPLRTDPTLAARLSLSQTKFATATPPQISDECAIVAALHDPLGDILEMQFRYAAKIEHKQNFANANVYPLTIGRFCEAVKDQVPKRDEWYQFQDPAFADGWEVSYQNLKSIIDAIDNTLDELVTAINLSIGNENDHHLGKHLTLGFEQQNDPDAVGYASLLLGRALAGLGATAKGHIAIRKGLGGAEDIPDADQNSGSSLNKPLRLFMKAWSGFSPGVFERIRNWQFSFDITLEAIALEVAAERAVLEGDEFRNAVSNAYRRSSTGTIMLTKRTVSYVDAVKFLQGAFDDAQVEDLLAGISPTGQLHMSALDTRMPTVDIPAVEMNGKLELVGGLRADRTIRSIETGTAGIGVLLGAWALVETATAHKKANELFEKGAMTGFLTSKEFTLTATAIGVADASLGLASKTMKMVAPAQQITQDALEVLYKKAIPQGADDLIYAPRLASASGIGRVVTTWLPRVSICLGLVMSVGGIYRGVERDDPAEIIGNSAMLIGTVLMLFPATAWLGAVVLLVGLGVTFLAYSDIEDVVRKCFWGSHAPYWELQVRPSPQELIEETRNLPGPWKQHLEEEIHWFEDLLWTMTIENKTADDGMFVIESPAFTEETPGTLDLSIRELYGRSWRLSYDLSNGEISGDDSGQIHVDAMAGSSTIVVKIDPPAGPDQQRHTPMTGYYYGPVDTGDFVRAEYTRGETGQTYTARLSGEGHL
ncbi:hypothetical protein TH25_23680 [Thalassospira profundimaris]|uniref:Toxin VasX N-terminal region domain-containing protein n=1 Tax=Thalassospira profundimaris TaxID=502049 RepID=A0A367WLJ6_9PROT|nr:toxin VasX [Thalassospira profundimaris]RCK41430.1 hypothetical protein TH25_23680 [Thalassospira profundimaris]